MITFELVCLIPSRFVEVRQVEKLLLADPRVNPSAEQDYAVQQACANGYVEVIKLLLADSRMNPSAHHRYAFRYASTV